MGTIKKGIHSKKVLYFRLSKRFVFTEIKINLFENFKSNEQDFSNF